MKSDCSHSYNGPRAQGRYELEASSQLKSCAARCPKLNENTHFTGDLHP